ncbi:MAG: UbiA family prenyltransferase [Chlorobi bacterium]|nr:UbiA family prenyltransferase [Chlorobiota bacterium]
MDETTLTLDNKINSILDQADRMFLSTAVNGTPSGSSVFFARDGEDLVFFTFNTTRKAEQIHYNPKVQVVIWPNGQEGIRGLQIEGECFRIKDEKEIQRARELVLATTTAFQEFMDDEFLIKNNVVGYYRIKPTVIKHVDFYAETKFEWKEYPQNQPNEALEVLRALKNRLLIWFRAARVPFFTASIVPILLGAVIAHGDLAAMGAEASWSWSIFFLALFGGLLAHAGTNISNDYFDHTSRNDEFNKLFSPFNGGSRMIQAGLLPPWKVLLAAVICFGATVAIGLKLNAILTGSAFGDSPLLWIGIAGVALGLLYTMSPVRLGYHGFGELSIALGFGPVMVLGTHYVLTAPYLQTANIAWHWQTPLLASVPVAILIMLVVWINQFQDAPADKKAGKNTWVVRLAELDGNVVRYDRPFKYYMVFNYFAFAYIFTLGLLGAFAPSLSTPLVWFAGLPFILAWFAIRWGREWLTRWNQPNADRQKLPYELLKVNVSTIGVHFLTGLLLILGFWIGY